MSTPAPALVITTPAETGGALSMLSEAASDRGVLSMPRCGAGALYPKLPPGPHPFAGESVASNQRARLYGAMIELVAACGYEASTVAELCGLAGVSKRTLYERFPGGKQQCFLATYDIIVHRAETHILGTGRRELDAVFGARPLQRLSVLVETFAKEVAAYPNAARLVLVEASGAGPSALARIERTTRHTEQVISWTLREEHDVPAPSPVLVERLLADGARLVRACLLDGRVGEMALLADELADLFRAAAASASPVTGASVRR